SRLVAVVRVEPGQDLSGGRPEALVDGRRLPRVGLGDEAQAGAVALQDPEGLVRRATVDHEVLAPRVVLVEDAEDRVLDEGSLVERRGDDRYQRSFDRQIRAPDYMIRAHDPHRRRHARLRSGPYAR